MPRRGPERPAVSPRPHAARQPRECHDRPVSRERGCATNRRHLGPEGVIVRGSTPSVFSVPREQPPRPGRRPRAAPRRPTRLGRQTRRTVAGPAPAAPSDRARAQTAPSPMPSASRWAAASSQRAITLALLQPAHQPSADRLLHEPLAVPRQQHRARRVGSSGSEARMAEQHDQVGVGHRVRQGVPRGIAEPRAPLPRPRLGERQHDPRAAVVAPDPLSARAALLGPVARPRGIRAAEIVVHHDQIERATQPGRGAAQHSLRQQGVGQRVGRLERARA